MNRNLSIFIKLIQKIQLVTLPVFASLSFSVMLALTVSACSVYKMEIQQGNAISNEAVAQLKPGMSKSEVATLLGNPLLQDSFHKDRWDYVYFAANKKGTSASPKNLTLLFQNGRLIQVK